MENIVVALGKRRPCLVHDAVLLHEVSCRPLLMPDIRLDLIDGGLHLVAVEKVGKTLVPETRDADRLDATFLIKLLHGAPGAIVVTVRLVNQVEIKIVQPELLHRSLNRLQGVVVAVILHPELRRDKKFLARDAALLDCGTNTFFIHIGGGCINEAITHRECIIDRAFRLHRRHLVNTIADLRHLDAIVQSDKFHHRFLPSNSFVHYIPEIKRQTRSASRRTFLPSPRRASPCR